MTTADGAPADLSVCGLGPMGAPIAARLIDAGTPLTVWNRTVSRAEPLGRRGASVARVPADAAARTVLTVLPDLPQVEELTSGVDGLLAGWRARGIAEPVLVIHGTTSPVATSAFARRMREDHSVTVIDAPLSGGTVGATAGTLSIMVGGDESVVPLVLPTFRAYGTVIRYFGPPGSGALAKACNQVVVAATVAAVSEALALGQRAGLDSATLIDVLEGGLASSEVLRQKKDKWLREDYAEGGSAVNQLKDLRFVEQAAESLGLRLPVAHAVTHLFESMVSAGDGALDHTGVIRTIRDGGADDAG